MKKLLKRLLKDKKPHSQEVLDALRARGARIGTDVLLYSPSSTIIDQTSAYLLSIGNHVRITAGVKILTHDYAWSAMKTYGNDALLPGAVLGAQGPVKIGDYVYIGMDSIIMRGVEIGDHVIIGAGSVVTKSCESNSVYAGNPARKICSLEAYYRKRMAQQFPEAREIALHYRERFGVEPPKEIFREYFALFATREEADQTAAFRKQMALLDSYDVTAAYMDQNPPMFDSYEAFLKACYQTGDGDGSQQKHGE